MLLTHLHDCGDWSPLRAMTVGVAINNVAPAKAGHFARAQVISAHAPISRLAAGSSFLLEALFDGLVVLAFVGVAVAFVPVGPEIRTAAAGFAVFMLLMLGLAGWSRRAASQRGLCGDRCKPRHRGYRRGYDGARAAADSSFTTAPAPCATAGV